MFSKVDLTKKESNFLWIVELTKIKDIRIQNANNSLYFVASSKNLFSRILFIFESNEDFP